MAFLAIPSLTVALLLGAANPPEETKNDLAPKAIETKPVSDGFPLPPGAEFRLGNRQMRHPEGVMNSALSSDGKYLATSGRKNLILWDTKTLCAKQVIQDLHRMSYHPYVGLTGLHFTPDSKRLIVSTSIDYSKALKNINEMFSVAQIWDVESGKMLHELSVNGPEGPNNATWVSGNEIATFANGYIRYWNSVDGKEIRKVGLDDYPCSFPWVTNGVDRIAFVSQNDKKLKVYDTRTGKVLFSLVEEQNQTAIQATFSPDGNLFVYQTRTNQFHVYNLATQKEIGTFLLPEKQENNPIPMRIAPDQRTLFLGSQKGTIFRWDVKENKKLPDLGRHSPGTILSTMVMSAEGKILYTMGSDKVIHRWDLMNDKQLPLPEGGYTTRVCMTLHANGKRLLVGDHSEKGGPFEWDLVSGKLITRWKPPQPFGIDCLARSSDGKWLASGTVMQEVQLWDLSLGKLTKSFPLVEKPDRNSGDFIHRVEFGPDNKVLYTTSNQTGLSAYEIETQKLLWRISARNEFVCDPKGRWLATTEPRQPPSSGPTHFYFVDPMNGKTMRTIEVKPELSRDESDDSGYPPWISLFTTTSDGSILITSHYQGTIRCWDSGTGREVRRIKVGGWSRNPIACSSDDRWIALGCRDAKIRIFEFSSGKEILRLEGHHTGCSQLFFAKDNRFLISNGDLAPLKWTLRPDHLPKLTDPLDSIWKDLASEDAAKVYRLQWALIDHPALAMNLFTTKIKPEDFTCDRKRFDQLLMDLENSKFAVREKTQKEILAKGEAIPLRWLQEALQASKTEEQKNRLQKLVEFRQQGPSINTLRMNRALYVLEQMQTPEAKELLQKYANGSQGPLADLAKATLERSTP